MSQSLYLHVNGNGDYRLLPFVAASVGQPGYLTVICAPAGAPSSITAVMDATGRVVLRRQYPLHAWRPPRTARIITKAFTWRDSMSDLVIEVREHSKQGCTLRISGIPVFQAAPVEPSDPSGTS